MSCSCCREILALNYFFEIGVLEEEPAYVKVHVTVF